MTPSSSHRSSMRSSASQTSSAESQHCHFAFVAELFMCGHPVGGTFWFQIFIQAPSPEIWRKTISGGEGGCRRGKWGGLVLGYLLGKNFRRRDRDHLIPPGGWMQQSAVPRCAILSVGSTGVTSREAARVHIACRGCGGSVAARRAHAAAGCRSSGSARLSNLVCELFHTGFRYTHVPAMIWQVIGRAPARGPG